MSSTVPPVSWQQAMHTTEHILTAVMRRLHGSSGNLEMHLGRDKSKCDYDVDRELTDADLRVLEAAVNAAIAADHPVSTRLISRSEAEARFDLRKVPAAVDRIRVVQIGNLDETPCSGAHVARTGRIGRFVLRTFSMKSDRVVRIRFGLETDRKQARGVPD